MTFAILLAFSAPVLANPTAPQVAAGSASFQTSGNTLTVTNAPGTIINWQSFSIGAGELTRFQQQSALSAVLNRVTGAYPSSIFGALTSNGRVFLVNPHGIVFGQGAVINTAGFIASTLNISDADFLAGRLKFEGGGHGVLKNAGTIQAGGDIFLVGPQIENSGLIRSDNGSVVLAAGQSLTISSPDAHGVQFALQAPTDAALNLGTLDARNAAAMFAGTLRHSGEIRAASASVDASGRVILAAQKDAIVDGNAVINADNSVGRGGAVQITGERVGLFDNATVTARGAVGGGEILVGGDVQGANPLVRNAVMTHVTSGATLDASATAAGDGGRVVVWADDTARVHGQVLARGGPQGGAGGFIETSGKRFLDVSGIRVSASGETAGTWLLDPYNIEIVAGGGTVNNGGAPAFTPGGDDSQIGADLITGQLDAGTSVSISTGLGGSPGTQVGDITVSSPIIKTANNAASLTLTANNNINVNANITLPNASVPGETASVTLNAGGDVAVNNATVQAGSVFVTAGGAIQRSGAQANDFLYGGTGTGDGALHLTANGGAIGAAGNAVRMQNNRYAGTNGRGPRATTTHDSGDIHLRYTGNGVYFDVPNAIQTNAGTTQTVRLEHTGTGTVAFYSAMTGNDDWIIDSAGSYGFAGTTLTANSVNATFGGSTGRLGIYPLMPAFDTSSANGNITITANDIEGTGCGGSQVGVGVKPGTGLVTATATASPGPCGGSIQLMHFGGDLLTSRYTLNFSNGAVAGNYMRLKAADGHLIVDSTAGFNASLNDKDVLLQTLAAGKDIVFQGGTVQGGRVEVRATRNIDNLAPGTNGFVQTNAFGGPHWKLYATGGGIGLTNPVEGTAEWVGDLVSGGVGALGDINARFNAGTGTPGIATISTHAGSAQNINITTAASLGFAPGQPGYGGSFSTANDHYTMNVGGSMVFTMFNDTATAASFDLTVAGSAVTNSCCGTTGRWISTTGALSITSVGGSIGESVRYANLPSSGGMTLTALNNIYVNAGANPLSLSGLTTGAGAGTIGLQTTAANDLTFGGTTNINDALVLSIGGNIIFPAASSFTTSGGLALNSPTQIAATASVNVTGGTLSGTGAINNAGTLTKANAGTSSFSGGFTNSGTVNVNAGTLDLAGGYTDAGGALVMGGGDITAPVAGLTLNTGTLGGSGTVTGNVIHNGTLNVGSSPGTMTIAGDLTLGAGSTLNIELGGTTQGVNYDLLQVTGAATLDGTLNVSLFGGFTGADGDLFDFMTYASRTGDFATINFPAGTSMTATPNAGFYQLLLSVPPPPPPLAAVDAQPSNEMPLKLAANDVRILQDRFFVDVQPAKDSGDEERKGAVLECR
ncbi:MAG: filamentous hemagglutinin N-terminal domain-containing protein [Burkholderiales bacterium]|nr:filamentous hemagglutinin N-terminal domain-containing protein [Burkholderiales bacterium]